MAVIHGKFILFKSNYISIFNNFVLPLNANCWTIKLKSEKNTRYLWIQKETGLVHRTTIPWSRKERQYLRSITIPLIWPFVEVRFALKFSATDKILWIYWLFFFHVIQRYLLFNSIIKIAIHHSSACCVLCILVTSKKKKKRRKEKFIEIFLLSLKLHHFVPCVRVSNFVHLCWINVRRREKTE